MWPGLDINADRVFDLAKGIRDIKTSIDFRFLRGFLNLGCFQLKHHPEEKANLVSIVPNVLGMVEICVGDDLTAIYSTTAVDLTAAQITEQIDVESTSNQKRSRYYVNKRRTYK
jgi:hypothetical protein